MKDKYNKNFEKIDIIFLLIFYSSIILSFIYKINLSNIFGPQGIDEFLKNYNIITKSGGSVSDLATHWKFIKELNKDLVIIFKESISNITKLLNYPLHHIFFSIILNDENLNIKSYILINFIFSLLLPVLLYLNLRIIFKEFSVVRTFLISSIIVILPGYQFTAIWGSNHITALIFFLISTRSLLKFNKNDKNGIAPEKTIELSISP